jgi:hypothetical protein
MTRALSSRALRVVLPLSAETAAVPVTATSRLPRGPAVGRPTTSLTASLTALTAVVSTEVTSFDDDDTETAKRAAFPSRDCWMGPGGLSPRTGPSRRSTARRAVRTALRSPGPRRWDPAKTTTACWLTSPPDTRCACSSIVATRADWDEEGRKARAVPLVALANAPAKGASATTTSTHRPITGQRSRLSHEPRDDAGT